MSSVFQLRDERSVCVCVIDLLVMLRTLICVCAAPDAGITQAGLMWRDT